ncbi:kinase-like domain-containing protein [Rhizophagus irregularis DAOM 181602=DAOM 197198]|nr:kinase-like domain-containing protein [Rhizophagus irregularis DAOM 181602=DAOM 197198]
MRLKNIQQKIMDFIINKAKECLTKLKLFVLYGISQNPNTNDYILVLFSEEYCVICDEVYTDVQYKWCKLCKFMSWRSGNDKIDDLIRLKINEPSDMRFEWIPYNQFDKITKKGKGNFITVYSAIWEYEIALLCFNDSQKFLDKVKEYDNSFKIYGLSQNPVKKDYILVLQNEYCKEYGKTYCKNCGGKSIVALKSLNNSNLTDKFLNEVKEYSIDKKSDVLNVYGISQNPKTKELIIVLEYAEGGSYNDWIKNNYKDFNWDTSRSEGSS